MVEINFLTEEKSRKGRRRIKFPRLNFRKRLNLLKEAANVVMQKFYRPGLVGLDIGSGFIKLVRLKKLPDGMHLQNFDIAGLPFGAIADNCFTNRTAIVEKIRDLVRLNKLKGADTALAISGPFTIVKRISLPEMTQEEFEEGIYWEAEQYIPFDIKDVNIDAKILNPKAGHGQMDVLLVAAKKNLVYEYKSVVQEAGLNPVLVDAVPFALQNMFEFNYGSNKGEIIALINIGANTTNINVVSDGNTMFTRDITIGGNLLNKEIMTKLDVTWEEAEQFKIGLDGSISESTVVREVRKFSQSISETITTEIQRALDFFIATAPKGVKISCLYLSGGGTLAAGLVGHCEKVLEVHGETVNPFKNIIIDSKKFDVDLLQRLASSATVAVGLGLRR